MIEAATRILSTSGRARFTTNRVAEVAGVSVGSLYQYFPNKESLLAEVQRRYDRQFMDRLLGELGHFGTLGLQEAVREFVRFMVRIHAESPKLHNELGAEMSDSERRYLRDFVRAYLEAHRAELRLDDLDTASHICLEVGETLIHCTALRYPERLVDERFIDAICDLLLRYLAKGDG